jgi:pimeloyl-ACP methyl ester carboxylesterase
MTETAVLPKTETVTSKDGTTIAFERQGAGPVIIVVDGAMCFREFGPARPFADAVAKAGGGFTVVCYDRRGRGGSGNTLPYAPEREVEDLTAVIDATGGDVFMLGFSSGAALAYETAASGASVKKVLGYEAPYVAENDPKHRETDHLAHLNALLADDSDKGRGKAVDYFMTTMVGGPAFMPLMMRLMGKVFRQLKGIAHTIPYDTQVVNRDFTVPRDRFARIHVPVLVAIGGKAKPNMVAAQDAVHAAISGSELRVLPGQTHQVSNDAIVPLAKEFFG